MGREPEDAKSTGAPEDRKAGRGARDDVTRANQAAQEEIGGEPEPEPDLAAGKQAAGARLGSTDAVDRAVEPLSRSDSDDTSESASTDRYAKR